MAFFGKKQDGLPGVGQEEGVSPELNAMLLTQPSGRPRIGEKEVTRAIEILSEYKSGKTMLERRVVEDELWWELRHWEVMRKKRACDDPAQVRPEPTSAWLFNSILNKHADAMDNYPEPVVLPREKSDEESAKLLSSVLPVVLEYNSFEQTYSDNWWEKLKHGTAPYGVFWNKNKENGLGDIDIREIDLLKMFWEPGVTDIQKSRNLFIVELVDQDILEQAYPEHKGKLGGSVIDVKEYIYDDSVDNSKKSLVVDWYYKVKKPNGMQVLHYAKFVGKTLLFASENEPEYQEKGFYWHGQYPVVLDVMFPEKGTPVGFGYVAICKDPQIYVDKLYQNVLENADQSTRKRFFVSSNTGINEEEFLNPEKRLVHVQGELDDRRIQEIVTQPLSSIYVDLITMKIEEMKDTASNRDVNSGSAGSGVTAAAAIAALQEAGNKSSRDMIAASYRTHTKIISMCIELMRQFYDVTRSFRITGTMPGSYEFKDMNNKNLQDQVIGMSADGNETMYRRPVFDVKIKAQKKNPFSRMEENERAKELYSLGFFNPDRAQEALGALEMMDFEGIEKVKEQVQQGQTLLNIVSQMQQQMDQMATIIQAFTGKDMGIGATAQTGTTQAKQPGQKSSSGVTDAVMNAQSPMTGYGQRLAERSVPDMNARSSAAAPQ